MRLNVSKKAVLTTGLLIIAILFAVLLMREILRRRMRPPPYLQLHSDGGWGTDSEIRIYPDDSFQVWKYDTRTGETDFRDGLRDGLFAGIVAMVDAEHAWGMTTASLNDEVKALTPEGTIIGAFDADHEFLELRLEDRLIAADIYAAESFLRWLPGARQLKLFAELATAIRRGTRAD